MDLLLDELMAELPDGRQVVRVVLRLTVALLLGGVIGFQRERTGKPAGLRTHMLVSLGAALFVLAPAEVGMNHDGLSRVIQGIAAGVGFLGGGAILKLHDARDVLGLTTAAGIWMTAAIGITVGLGRSGLALLSVILAWIVLGLMGDLELRWRRSANGAKRR